MNLYFSLLSVLLLCPIIHSCTHRHAKVRIINYTGVKIEFLTLAHIYSDVYKNAKIFSNIDSNRITNSSLIVEYHTGFLCYGTDWWWLTWTNSNNQVFTINSKSSYSCLSNDEKSASKMSSKISNRGTKLYIIDKPDKSTADNQSTCGYMSYMLQNGDDGGYVNIYLYPYAENGIVIESPSGKATVDYTSDERWLINRKSVSLLSSIFLKLNKSR